MVHVAECAILLTLTTRIPSVRAGGARALLATSGGVGAKEALVANTTAFSIVQSLGGSVATSDARTPLRIALQVVVANVADDAAADAPLPLDFIEPPRRAGLLCR
jgi:hypothetical protein